jgi:hypothetical protein
MEKSDAFKVEDNFPELPLVSPFPDNFEYLPFSWQ